MTRPVPILLMVRALGLGGSERQLTEIARFLDPTRFEPHVGCLFPEGVRRAELEAAHVPIFSTSVRSFKSPAALRGAFQVTRYIRRHRIQIVHTFDVPMNVFGVPSGRLAGAPIVLSSQRAHRNLSSPFYRRLLQVVDRMVNGVVVNCEAMRRHLIEDEGVPADRIHLCYNGIDTDAFFPASGDRPGKLSGATVIGVICALRPEKDLATLIRAFAAIREEFPGLRLLIVGSGPEESPLKALADELKVTNACHFEPGTSEVVRWMRCIDIFVLPSLSEALSNSLMEAMACGCCPVASRVGGNPELVTPNETGLLFKPGSVMDLVSQLRILLTDTDARRRMAEASATRIHSEFTHHAASSQMAQIYENLLDANRTHLKRL